MEQDENNDAMLTGGEATPNVTETNYLEVPQRGTNSLVLFRFNQRRTNQTSSQNRGNQLHDQSSRRCS